jgi:hypothetical protein
MTRRRHRRCSRAHTHLSQRTTTTIMYHDQNHRTGKNNPPPLFQPSQWMLPLLRGLLLPRRPPPPTPRAAAAAAAHHCYQTSSSSSNRRNSSSSNGPQQARLVLNHSTHLEGLLPTLRRVIEALPPPKLSTIVPGRIAVCRGEFVVVPPLSLFRRCNVTIDACTAGSAVDEWLLLS